MTFRQVALDRQAKRIKYLPRHERKGAAKCLCLMLITLLNPVSPLKAGRTAVQRSHGGERIPYLSILTKNLPEKGTP